MGDVAGPGLVNAPARWLAGKRVLVVEDAEVYAMLLRRAFEAAGWQVATAAGVAEARACLAAASFDPARAYMSDKLRGTLVRLTYIGDVTYQPILSRIMAGAKVQVTILQGEVSSIKDVPFGQLLLELEGSEDDIRAVFAELDRHQIHHEVLQ